MPQKGYKSLTITEELYSKLMAAYEERKHELLDRGIKSPTAMTQDMLKQSIESEGRETVKIPKPLWQDITQFIKAHPELHYKSVSEFVTDAVRLKVKELEK